MRFLGRSSGLAILLSGFVLTGSACQRNRDGAASGASASPSAGATASASPAKPGASPSITESPSGVITERRVAPDTQSSTITLITASDLAKRMDDTRVRLESWIHDGVADEKLPWAMAHGLLAFGPELRTHDGRFAIDAIVDDNAKRVNGHFEFPGKTPAGGVVDAHPHLMVKKMLEAKVPWDRVFQVPSAGKVTLERLAVDATRELRAPHDETGWAAAPWTIIIALAEAKHRAKLSDAERRRLTGLALQTLAELENEQDFLTALLEQQRPDLVQKQKQHIYAHPCGGLHFVQAALHAAAFIGTAEAFARARKQLEVVMFRWIAERDIYRRTSNTQPQYRLLILVQELKFYGHILEVFALAQQLGIVSREPELLVQLGGVAQDLLRTIDLLASAYGQLDRLRATSEQTYLDVIGDGAHAVHGLREASVAFFRPQ